MHTGTLPKLFLLLALAAGFPGLAQADEPAPFILACDRVESILVELFPDMDDLDSENQRWDIGCQVQLTFAAAVSFEEHRRRHASRWLPIHADGLLITMYDGNVRAIPQTFFFTEQTWEQARRKLMAICADKIPPIPRRVLEHRPRE
ncbi:hypothetical protein [Pseudodesulfovibrio pelocollis]|uniref:hypothetical protein n=1 Tax=Pseudodesulfovibrio pelocollis TaxID=3051432 RepID=UPI00255A919D|nr:hypothetical protein [Pseudodesulfovibrio sp. SB368]